MALFGFGKDEHGEVPVPGEGTVSLPAGKVGLRYVEERAGRGTKPGAGKLWTGPGKDLKVTVKDASGAEVPVSPPTSVRRGMGRAIHQEIGSVEIPSEGAYSVATSMTAGEENLSPRVVFRS